MKLYAVQRSEGRGEPRPYIAAEMAARSVELDPWLAKDSAAVELNDPKYLSREELLATEEGRQALEAWESDDQTVLDEEVRYACALSIFTDLSMIAGQRSQAAASFLVELLFGAPDTFARAEAIMAEDTARQAEAEGRVPAAS